MPARSLPHFGTVEAEASAAEAARVMARGNYSCLVVTRGTRAVGLLTDGDLTMRVIAEERSPERTRVAEVMSCPPVSASPDQSFAEVVERMAAAQVRQLPVVEDGELRGLVSLDDLVEIQAGDLDDLAMAVRHEIWLTRIGEPDPLRGEDQIRRQLGWFPGDRSASE
jgi:signal-transduction protein with cAMP-binding, CBS, and nucleotidyltransferase domain